MNKCKFCGIENDQVILDKDEYVCSDITKCSERMVENARILAKKFLENTVETRPLNFHKGQKCINVKGKPCQENSCSECGLGQNYKEDY